MSNTQGQKRRRNKLPRYVAATLTTAVILLTSPPTYAIPPQLAVAGIYGVAWILAVLLVLWTWLAGLSHVAKRYLFFTVAALFALPAIVVALDKATSTSGKDSEPFHQLGPSGASLAMSATEAAGHFTDPTTLWVEIRSDKGGGVLKGPKHSVRVDFLLPGRREGIHTLFDDDLSPLKMLKDHPHDPSLWGKLPDNWYRTLLAEVPSLARIDALYRQRGTKFERVIVLSETGTRGVRLARLLRLLDINSFGIEGGAQQLRQLVSKKQWHTYRSTPWRNALWHFRSPKEVDEALLAKWAEDPHTVWINPTMPMVSVWARYIDSPPPGFPPPDQVTRICFLYDGSMPLRSVLWSARLARGWGYDSIEILTLRQARPLIQAIERLSHARWEDPRSLRDIRRIEVPPIQPAQWFALFGFLLLFSLISPVFRVRTRIAGRRSRATEISILSVQIILLILLDYLGPGHLARNPLVAIDFDAPWLFEPLDTPLAGCRDSVAETLACSAVFLKYPAFQICLFFYLMIWMQLARREDALLEGFKRKAARLLGSAEDSFCGMQPLRIWRFRAGDLVAAIAIGWISTVTLITTTFAALLTLLAREAGERIIFSWLYLRMRHAKDPDLAALRLLAFAGLPVRRSAASQQLMTRSESNPAHVRWLRKGKPDLDLCLFDHHEEPDRQATMNMMRRVLGVVGRDCQIGLTGGLKPAIVSIRLLDVEAPARSHVIIQQQMIDIVRKALYLGHAPENWHRLSLSNMRFEEAAPEATPLTLGFLLMRFSNEGAGGRAAWRFGSRLPAEPVVRLGRRLYELVSYEASPIQPGFLARFRTRVFTAIAHREWSRRIVPQARMRIKKLDTSAKNPKKALRKAHRQLPQLSSLWAEETARACWVANRRTERIAKASTHPPMPPLSPQDTARRKLLELGEHPYELASISDVKINLDDLPSSLSRPKDLAYGPGPASLCRWRGIRRVAEEARDGARVLMATELAAFARALRNLPNAVSMGDDLFFLRWDELDLWLRGKSPKAPTSIRRESFLAVDDLELPGQLSLENLGQHMAGAAQKDERKWQGVAVSGGLPLKGRAWLWTEGESSSNLGDDVLILRRLTPTLLEACRGAKGIIAEVGGPLSHAATLAREAGIPTILGVSGITRFVRHGEAIEMREDGSVSHGEKD